MEQHTILNNFSKLNVSKMFITRLCTMLFVTITPIFISLIIQNVFMPYFITLSILVIFKIYHRVNGNESSGLEFLNQTENSEKETFQNETRKREQLEIKKDFLTQEEFEAEINKQSFKGLHSILDKDKLETTTLIVPNDNNDDFVVIKGIKLSRRKGNRLLTYSELYQEFNFEFEKRSFDERAAKLRTISFNGNKADVDEETDVPAFIRRGVSFDTNSPEYSNIRIDNDKENPINKRNQFLSGKSTD